MWHFVSQGDSHGNPFLETTNDFVGRQYWEFDPSAGTPDERAEVDRLRKAFTASRHKKRDSDDALIRLQARHRISQADIVVPSEPLSENVAITKLRMEKHLEAGIRYYQCLQEKDGHWPGDYGGPMFLLPGLVITAYVTKTLDHLFPTEAKKEIIRYLKNHQNEDGGFGLHIEGPSCMFGTSIK